MNYQVTWTDKNTGEDHSSDHGDSLDAAKRDANTKSNLHCSAFVMAFENGKNVGSLSYNFGRREEVEGDIE